MVALVLGGGAAKGYAHIGFLKGLEGENLTPDCIIGCSMGALVGAFYTSGVSTSKMIEIASKIDTKKIAYLFFPKFLPTGLTDGDRIIGFLKKFIGEKKIEELNPKFMAVAVDLEEKKEVVIEKGDLISAVRASISIPLVFSPIVYDDMVLVDGGVVDPVPIRVAREKGFDKVIAVNVLPREEIGTRCVEIDKANLRRRRQVKIKEFGEILREGKSYLHFLFDINLLSILFDSFTIMEFFVVRNSIEKNPPDLLIEPDLSQYKVYEFHKAKQIIEAGYKAFLEKKQEILKIFSRC